MPIEDHTKRCKNWRRCDESLAAFTPRFGSAALVLALGLALTLPAACSSTETPLDRDAARDVATDSPAPGDASSLDSNVSETPLDRDAARDVATDSPAPGDASSLDSNVCVVPLADIGCAPTYEMAGDSACSVCRTWESGCPRTGGCDSNTLFYEEGNGYELHTCFYDVTTHKLVAGTAHSDTDQYCNGLSFSAQAGLDGLQCDGVLDAAAGSPYCASPDGGDAGD